MNTGNGHNTKKLIITALFSALVCVATIAIRIPTPGTGGYVHPGDALVIIAGIILGPAWGALAAGIGSALADLLGGYFIFVPITFAIKGAVALSAGVINRIVRKKTKKHFISVIIGGLADVIIVGLGYFVCEIPMYGLAASLLTLPSNLLQGASGLVIALLMYPIVRSIPDIRRFSDDIYNSHNS